jgi:hypothetical protein
VRLTGEAHGAVKENSGGERASQRLGQLLLIAQEGKHRGRN